MRSQLPRTFRSAIRASLPVFAACCAVSQPARSDWTVATSASLSHDNNVGNAQSYSSKVADSNLSAALSLLQLLSLGENFSLAAGGDASGQIYDHFTGLNNASLDAVLSLKEKWGMGAYAPWTRVGISVGRANFTALILRAIGRRVAGILIGRIQGRRVKELNPGGLSRQEDEEQQDDGRQNAQSPRHVYPVAFLSVLVVVDTPSVVVVVDAACFFLGLLLPVTTKMSTMTMAATATMMMALRVWERRFFALAWRASRASLAAR